jgi:hypothetical protein
MLRRFTRVRTATRPRARREPARAAQLWVALPFVLALGCSDETALLIEVTHQNPNAAFTGLKVHVFDAHGALGSKDVAPVLLPGVLTLHGLPDRAQNLRVVVAADGLAPAIGGAEVMTLVHARATAVVDLTASLIDSDGDSVPDTFDVCPAAADPGQESTRGGAPGNACGGLLPLPDAGVADDASVPDFDAGTDFATPPGDGSIVGPPDLAHLPDLLGPNVLLYDDFTDPTVDTTRWAITKANGGSVTVSNGMLLIQAAATANAYAEVASLLTFPVGTTFTARVNFGAGQTYDEKGVGFANARLSDGCAGGETEAALMRGFNDQMVIEPKAGNISQCLSMPGEPTPYPSGFRIIKIVRLNAGQIDFYDNANVANNVARVPGGLLPARMGVFTSTVNPPAATVNISVDWVMVTLN